MSSEPTDTSPQELLAHSEWVRRIAAAIVRADDADDVAQQAFAQALGARRPSRNLRAWFTAIVRNVARRRRRDDATRARYEAFAEAALDSGDPALAVARAELHRRVVDAVLALAEPYRSTLVLRYFDEKSAEEIARAQALPLETVRTRVKRGLAQLRATFDEGGGRDGAALQRSLALLLVPGSRAASVMGALAMGATSKGVLAVVGAVVVAAIAWRWMAPGEDVTLRHDVAASATSPAEAAVAAPLLQAERAADAPGDASFAVAAEPVEFSIEGRVVDERGAAVAGARVLLVSGAWSCDPHLAESGAKFLDDDDEFEPRRERAIRSAHDGTFRFDGVDPYRRLSVVAIDEFVGIGAKEAPTHATAEPVVVELAPLVVVSGRITDVEGRPAARTWVAFNYGSDELHLDGCRSMPLRPDGSFCFTTDDRTRVLVPVAQCPDGRVARGETISFPPGAPLRRTVEFVLREPEPCCRGRIVDSNGDVFDLRAALKARLLDWECSAGTDSAVFGAQLIACRGDEPPPAEFRMNVACRIGGIDLGSSTYFTELAPEAKWIALVVRDRVVGAVAAPLADAGERGPDLRVDFSRLPSAPARESVHVRLVAAESGVPLDDSKAAVELSVTVENASGQAIGVGFYRPPSRGEFARGGFWFDHIERGRIVVTALVPGRVAGRRVLAATPRAEPYEVEIALERADADLRGIVVDTAGRGVASASVAFVRSDGDSLEVAPSTTTNADGRFHLLGIERGAGLLRVEAEGGTAAVLPWIACAGAEIGCVTLAPKGRLEIEVGPDEEIAQVRVVSRDAGTPPLALAVTPPAREYASYLASDPRHAARVECVAPGRYSCSVASGDVTVELLNRAGAARTRAAVVVANETAAVSFVAE